MERLFEMVIISELFHDSLVQRKIDKIRRHHTQCVESLISASPCLKFDCGRGEITCCPPCT